MRPYIYRCGHGYQQLNNVSIRIFSVKYDIRIADTGEDVYIPRPLDCSPLQSIMEYNISQEDPRVFSSVDPNRKRRWPEIPYPVDQPANIPNTPHPDPEGETRRKEIGKLLDHMEEKVHKDIDFLHAHGRQPIKTYREKDQKRIYNKIRSGDLQCEVCADGHNFASTQKLKNHYRSVHFKKTPYLCPEPGCQDMPDGFNNSSTLRSHIIAKHKKDPGSKRKKIPPKPAQQLTCPNCGWKTYSSSEFKRHQKEHTENFDCPHCNKTNKHKKGLTDHLASSCPVLRGQGKYDDLEKYECDQCGKEFAQERSLRRHEKKHL